MQSNMQFNITFRGDIEPQVQIESVRHAFRDIFHANESQLDKIFSGRVLTLMRDLDKEEAEQARKTLASVGAITFLTRASQPREQAYEQSSEQSSKQSSKQSPERLSGLQLQARLIQQT